MDLIIKNLDHLRNYHNGHNVPIGKVVLDFDKLGKDDFTQIFFSACEKYAEVGESYLVPNEDIKKAMKSEKTCITCKYHALEVYEEPCQSCIESYLALDEMNPNWEPAEPNLKEVTERMQSEFDATGKDVKIFMNGRIIKR